MYEGLKINNELSPVDGVSPIEILVCDANEGAYAVASKLHGEYNGIVTVNEINQRNLSIQSAGNERVMMLYLNDKAFVMKIISYKIVSSSQSTQVYP